MKDRKKTIFIVLQENTRSLSSSERLEEMFSEIHKVEWDAILISETWRQSKEIWETQQGHIMVESGKFTNKHGVAILLNKRWKNRINWIQCACERVVAMSISVNGSPGILKSMSSSWISRLNSLFVLNDVISRCSSRAYSSFTLCTLELLRSSGCPDLS